MDKLIRFNNYSNFLGTAKSLCAIIGLRTLVLQPIERRRRLGYADMGMSVGTAALLSISFDTAVYVFVALVVTYGALAQLRHYYRFRTTFTSSFWIDLTGEHDIYLPTPAFQGELLVSLGDFRKDYIGKVSITGFAQDSPVGSFCTSLGKPELIFRMGSSRRGPETIVVAYNFDQAVTKVRLRLELEPAWTGRLVREFGIYPEKCTKEIVRMAVHERRS